MTLRHIATGLAVVAFGVLAAAASSQLQAGDFVARVIAFPLGLVALLCIASPIALLAAGIAGALSPRNDGGCVRP